MATAPRVALVVLNWNAWDSTRRCLDSATGLTYRPLDIYLVDNGSRDGSPDRVAASFPGVNLIRLPENLGYGGGMNAGIQKALEEGGDHILCLNNDMTLDPGFLEPLVEAVKDGTVPYPALFQGEDHRLLDNAGNRLSYTGLTSLIAHGERDVPTSVMADYTELPFLPRRLLERIGAYKEEYFAFYEDVDLCLRIRDAGWDFRFVPASKIAHRRGSTTRRIPGLISYYSVRNRLLMIRDNGSGTRWLITALHVLLLTLPSQLLESLANPESKHSARHLLSGLRDGLLTWRRGVTRRWPVPA
ncbi:MAG: glycosyltransferase family 2 protein [Thermoplasmata archaeon]